MSHIKSEFFGYGSLIRSINQHRLCQQVPLGHYPEDHFTEEIPRQLQKDYKAELDKLSITINNRNKTLEIPYTYLDPKNVENSVAI